MQTHVGKGIELLSDRSNVRCSRPYDLKVGRAPQAPIAKASMPMAAPEEPTTACSAEGACVRCLDRRPPDRRQPPPKGDVRQPDRPCRWTRAAARLHESTGSSGQLLRQPKEFGADDQVPAGGDRMSRKMLQDILFQDSRVPGFPAEVDDRIGRVRSWRSRSRESSASGRIATRSGDGARVLLG